MTQMNQSTKQKQTHRLSHTEWINNKDLLYSMGTYIQCSQINHNGKEYTFLEILIQCFKKLQVAPCTATAEEPRESRAALAEKRQSHKPHSIPFSAILEAAPRTTPTPVTCGESLMQQLHNCRVEHQAAIKNNKGACVYQLGKFPMMHF